MRRKRLRRAAGGEDDEEGGGGGGGAQLSLETVLRRNLRAVFRRWRAYYGDPREGEGTQRTGTPAADSASIHEAAVVAVALATRTRPGMASFVRKESAEENTCTKTNARHAAARALRGAPRSVVVV